MNDWRWWNPAGPCGAPEHKAFLTAKQYLPLKLKSIHHVWLPFEMQKCLSNNLYTSYSTQMEIRFLLEDSISPSFWNIKITLWLSLASQSFLYFFLVLKSRFRYYFHVKSTCSCSVTKSCLTLCDLMDCSMPGLPVLLYLPELAQTHVHWVSDAIQPSHPLSFPSLAFYLSQHQALFQRVGFSYQVAKVLELQLQHQSFQWIFRTDFL